MRLALLAGAATLVACAHEPAPRLPEARTLAGVEACSATVFFTIGNQAGATAPIRSATMYALLPGAGNISAVEVPGTVSVAWQDTLYRTSAGGTSRSRSAQIRIFNVAAGESNFDLNHEVYPRCGEQLTRALPLPMTRTLEVTSDPAGASVFLRTRVSMYGYEYKYVGVTPLNISARYEPDESFTRMRLEKSGYQAVEKEAKRTDHSIRVVMQPLPRH